MTIEDAARLLWNYHRIDDKLSPADAIIGLGSYDLRVADRCAELFLHGLAPQLLFTGKSGNWTQGLYQASEAEAFAERAIELGVPRHSILIEPRATNIGENIRFSRDMLDDAKRVMIVTKPQTQRRAFATVKKQWPEITALVTAPQIDFAEQPTRDYPVARLINEMVGDIQRIQTYPARGFQIEQALPEEVIAAYEFLIGRGFDTHLE
ncbi:MAG: YdcF family protein [Phyllobacterium sp.]